MARFFGNVGYGGTVETKPGVWQDNIIEKPYYGDIVRTASQLTPGQNLNNDFKVNNSISIVADAFANVNFQNIRYAEWGGVRWEVTSVQVQPPRLILQLGGVYDGLTPSVDGGAKKA